MHRRIVGLLVFVIVVSGLLAGCGATATPTTVPTKAATTAAPTVAPTKAPATAPAATTAATVASTKAATAASAATAAPTAAATGAAASTGLKITGKVGSPQSWTEAAVRAMKTTQAQSKDKSGAVQTYTGVLINDLLALAKPAADAKTIVFVAGDGFTAEIALAEVTSCTNCIVSFREQGGFSTVLPDKATNLQVKGVVEIQVK